MKSHAATIVAVFLSAITCGATFLLALYRQLALVEVAAMMAVGVQLYLLSSSIGDMLEGKPAPSKRRLLVAVGLTVTVVGYFLVAKTVRQS